MSSSAYCIDEKNRDRGEDKWTLYSGVVVNTDWHPDEIYIYLGDKSLGKPIRDYLIRLASGNSTRLSRLIYFN